MVLLACAVSLSMYPSITPEIQVQQTTVSISSACVASTRTACAAASGTMDKWDRFIAVFTHSNVRWIRFDHGTEPLCEFTIDVARIWRRRLICVRYGYVSLKRTGCRLRIISGQQQHQFPANHSTATEVLSYKVRARIAAAISTA